MSKETIRVVAADDDPEMLAMVSRQLKKLGVELRVAANGEDALRLIQDSPPDLVVLDVMMPGMNGWEVCRKIRENRSLDTTGVIMLTGIGERLNEMTSPLYGADEYLDKPFEFEDFEGCVKRVLRKRRA